MNSERRIQEWAEPKSLSEFAEQAVADESGIRCPKCNCADWRVGWTRDGMGVIKRQRVCRNPNCGHSIHTTEKPIGVPEKRTA